MGLCMFMLSNPMLAVFFFSVCVIHTEALTKNYKVFPILNLTLLSEREKPSASNEKKKLVFSYCQLLYRRVKL